MLYGVLKICCIRLRILDLYDILHIACYIPKKCSETLDPPHFLGTIPPLYVFLRLPVASDRNSFLILRVRVSHPFLFSLWENNPERPSFSRVRNEGVEGFKRVGFPTSVIGTIGRQSHCHINVT